MSYLMIRFSVARNDKLPFHRFSVGDSVRVTLNRSVQACIYSQTCLSVCLSVYLFLGPFTNLAVYLRVCLSTCLSVCLAACLLSVCLLSVCLSSVCLLSVCLSSVCLSSVSASVFCLCVCLLSVCACVCLSVSLSLLIHLFKHDYSIDAYDVCMVHHLFFHLPEQMFFLLTFVCSSANLPAYRHDHARSPVKSTSR